MRLFYASDIEGGFYTFNSDESRHIIRVLRLNNGDKILITDGQGSFYECEIIDAHQKKCQVKILKKTEAEKHDYHLHIAIAPTKNIDRFEWFLEKATEIGIDEITPIITDYSERKIVKHGRLRKVIESAMKQSYKAHHPKLNELITLDRFLQREHEESVKLIAHCYDGEKFQFKDCLDAKESVLILIGPEGDFSLEEVINCQQKDYRFITLGNYRLRTETAGVVACNYVSFIN